MAWARRDGVEATICPEPMTATVTLTDTVTQGVGSVARAVNTTKMRGFIWPTPTLNGTHRMSNASTTHCRSTQPLIGRSAGNVDWLHSDNWRSTVIPEDMWSAILDDAFSTGAATSWVSANAAARGVAVPWVGWG